MPLVRPYPRAQAVSAVDRLVLRFWEFDARWDARLEPARNSASLARVMVRCSKLGLYSLFWYALGVAGYFLSTAGRRFWAVFTVSIALEFILTNGVVKALVRRSRPEEAALQDRITGLHRPRTSSFPSGHSSAAAMASALLTTQGALWVGVTAMAVLIGVSRVYLRLHHASDVLAGLAWGLLLGSVVRIATL